jgi:hypothetical protein
MGVGVFNRSAVAVIFFYSFIHLGKFQVIVSGRL